MALAFILLALTVLSLWLGGDERAPWLFRHGWLLVFGASLAAALAAGTVGLIGLAWIAALAGCLWVFRRPQAARWQMAIAAAGTVALAAGLMLHRLPGFHNLRVIDAVRFTPDAVPFTLHLNYDKTLLGLFLLGWAHARIRHAREWLEMLLVAAPRACGVIAVVMVLSVASGYVAFAPKFPAETWLWMGVNLGFTCMAEEAFFRGFVQAQLQRLWQDWALGRWVALGVAALLFGAAHFAGGAAYVGLASVAGLGYGWVYQRTGRIEASILTHFALNALHFLLFTYPALQRTG